MRSDRRHPTFAFWTIKNSADSTWKQASFQNFVAKDCLKSVRTLLCYVFSGILRHFFLRKRLLTSVLNKKFSADVICGQSSILWQRGYPRHFRIKNLTWFCQFLAWLLSWPTVMSSREWVPLEGTCPYIFISTICSEAFYRGESFYHQF